MQRRVLIGALEIRADADELTVRDRHAPHGSRDRAIYGFDDDAGFRISDIIRGIESHVGAAAHIIVSNQRVQRTVAVRIDLIRIGKARDVIIVTFRYHEGLAEYHGGILTAHI